MIILLSALCVLQVCYALFPYQNTSLPWDQRTSDLVSRMTLEEIQWQSMSIYNHPCPAIDRLGIRSYNWITECLSGQARVKATSFPQALGVSASWDVDLIQAIAEATSLEVRAHYNSLSSATTFFGLTCFSPVINIMRHPLWGRNQETYGEDPFLTGTLAQHYVQGLQGNHPRYVRVAAGCKHFDVHGGPENIPESRFSFNAKVSTRDWRQTFLPQFKMCVEAGSYSMMCSYNRLNGIPACANKQLLTTIPRQEWGWDGYIVSDAGAVMNVIDFHHYLNNSIDTTAACIKAGCNLELSSYMYNSTLEAVYQGKLTEADVRNNIYPLMYTRLRLGEFDPPEMNPYTKIPLSVIQSEKHRALGVRAASESFVLLKNQNKTLPLKGPIKQLGIVGPFSNTLKYLYGDYSAKVNATYAKTPYQGLQHAADVVQQANGCNAPMCKQYNKQEVLQAVQGSDVIVVCLGLGDVQESEGRDRNNLDLPGQQLDLLKDVINNANGASIILLLFNAGPLDVRYAHASHAVGAILACTYPAQATGEALYNTLTAAGPYSVPAARLTATWPANMEQVPPMTDYTMEGHTYRYFQGDPLYPFGYGLSYSTFSYDRLSIYPSQIIAGEDVTVNVDVYNHGPYDADEVAQVYIRWVSPPSPAPIRTLVAFSRFRIPNGGRVTKTFIIAAERMPLWVTDETGFTVPKGRILVYVGGQQPDEVTRVPSNVVSGSFIVK